jgi:hypothetical protein
MAMAIHCIASCRFVFIFLFSFPSHFRVLLSRLLFDSLDPVSLDSIRETLVRSLVHCTEVRVTGVTVGGLWTFISHLS